MTRGKLGITGLRPEKENRACRIDIRFESIMVETVATITLKNVPDEVHAALKQRARRHKRSLNQEAILCLDLALGRGPRDPQAKLARIRSLRSRFPTKPVDLDWIDNAKRQGRP
jgi:antitoxin FitA